MASYDEAIPPGEEGTIRFKVKTGHLRGKVKRSVTVHSNDPATPKKILLIALDSVGSVEILPTQRIVLNDRNENSSRSKLLLRKDSTETGTLAVADLRSSSPLLKMEIRPAEEAEKFEGRQIAVRPGDWILEVGIKEKPEPGLHRETVRFRTGLSREPEITIPVTITVRKFLHVNRRQIVLNEPAPGSSVSGDLIATLKRGLDPGLLEVSVTPDSLRLSKEMVSATGMRVTVTLDPDGSEVPARGKIRFSHEGRSLEVPVRVNRRRQPVRSAPAAGS